MMDEELRNIILKGTAKVELALRSRFAYLLALDGNAYTNEKKKPMMTEQSDMGLPDGGKSHTRSMREWRDAIVL